MARAWSWVVLLVAVVAGGWLGELASACTADNCSVWGTWTDKTSATDTEHWWYSLTEEGPCAFKGNTLNGTQAIERAMADRPTGRRPRRWPGRPPIDRVRSR